MGNTLGPKSQQFSEQASLQYPPRHANSCVPNKWYCIATEQDDAYCCFWVSLVLSPPPLWFSTLISVTFFLCFSCSIEWRPAEFLFRKVCFFQLHPYLALHLNSFVRFLCTRLELHILSYHALYTVAFILWL